MRNRMTLFGVVVMLVAMAITAFCLWRNTPVGVENLWVPAPAATVSPIGPSCTHEHCFERPAYLQCVYKEAGTGHRSDVCMRFEIEYRRRCYCDTWAAP